MDNTNEKNHASQQDVEYRVCRGLEVRQADGEGMPTIVGYAAVFDVLAELAPGRSERIRPSAFTESLESDVEVYALVGHNRTMVLGRRGAGTLEVREDRKGVFVTIKPPNTQVGRDAVESIRRGDIDGMSVGMRIQDAPITIEDGQLIQSIERALLRDISVAAYAAYSDTTISLRSFAAFEEQAASVKRGLPVKLAKEKLNLLELTTP